MKNFALRIFHISDANERQNQVPLVGRHCKKDATKNVFTNRVINVWNNLPNILKDI